MKRLSLETLVPDNFKFAARDMDGKVFAFENKPNIATDIACDTWDVKEGKFLQITSQPQAPLRISSNSKFSTLPLKLSNFVR